MERWTLIDRTKEEMCESEEWPLHHFRENRDYGMWKILKADLTHSVATLERSDDAIKPLHAQLLMATDIMILVMYDNRQGWQNVQHFPHGFSPCADKPQVKATWRCEDETSPSPTHMYQSNPCFQIFDSKEFVIHIESEDF